MPAFFFSFGGFQDGLPGQGMGLRDGSPAGPPGHPSMGIPIGTPCAQPCIIIGIRSRFLRSFHN